MAEDRDRPADDMTAGRPDEEPEASAESAPVEDGATAPAGEAAAPQAGADEPEAEAESAEPEAAGPEEAEAEPPAAASAGEADEEGADGEETASKPAPKPAAKPAARPAAKAAAAAAGEEEMTRRGLFSWAAVAWVGFSAAIGGCMTAFGRFMFPNVLFEPPTSFKVGLPEDFPEGVVDERFKDTNGVWIVNEDGQIYALIAICTHLGCPPTWLEAQNKFKCPCHGSGYYKNGINFEGPTPRPLERARITISPDDGQIVVDKGQKYQWELGQWEDPASYITVG